MTGIGQTASTTEVRLLQRTSQRYDDNPLIEVVPAVRQVQPGSWSPCTRCRAVIAYVPGGDRNLVVLNTYANGELHHVELFHADCYTAPI